MSTGTDEAARRQRNLRLAWAHGVLALVILAGFVIAQVVK